MSGEWRLKGHLVRGAGRAASFTQVDWVQEQCARKLKFAPHPGTLNVRVDDAHRAVIGELQAQAGIPLVAPADDFCSAKTLPATVGGIRCAVIIPEESVRIHGRTTVEIIAPVSLTHALDLHEGDEVEIVVKRPQSSS